MKVAVVQHDIVWQNADATHAALTPMIADAAAAGARLVVLTEMFATGFSMATDKISQPVDGPSVRFLEQEARKHGVWVAGSVSTALGDGLPVNRLWLVNPEGGRQHYDKIHPFSYANEHEHYRGGSQFVTVDVEGVRVTLFVCYDLRFADEFWVTALDTDVYLVVANWPAARGSHWRALLPARAIENQAYVVAANRCGSGGSRGQLSYDGDSMIVDPAGEILAHALPGAEQIIYADVAAEHVAEVRREFPFLQDRR